MDEDVDRTSIDVEHVCDTRTTRRGDAWRVANRHDLDNPPIWRRFASSKPRSRPLVPARFILLVFTHDAFVFTRKGAAKGPNSVLRAEMARVPGIILVRTIFLYLPSVRPYKMPGTLVHWYSTRAVPGRPGLLHSQSRVISAYPGTLQRVARTAFDRRVFWQFLLNLRAFRRSQNT